MEKKCAKCGKKLGLLNKVPIKDGYLCKECAKEYKDSITDEKLKFKELSIEALEEKHTQANQKNLMMIGALILVIVVGIAFLAISGSSKEDGENLSKQNEKAEAIEEDEDAADNWKEEIDDEESTDEVSEKDENRKYKCGDTAHYDDYNITIENPTNGAVLKIGTGWFSYRHGMKMPITIECKNDVTIEKEAFTCIVTESPGKKELPDKLEMKAGDLFKGYIYAPWGADAIKYDDVQTLFSDKDDIEESTWRIKYKPKAEECKAPEDLYLLLPGDKVTMTVYFQNVLSKTEEKLKGYDNMVEVCYENDDNSGYLYLSANKESYKKFKKSTWSSMDKYKIKGVLVQLETESDDGIYTSVVLDDVSIID